MTTEDALRKQFADILRRHVQPPDTTNNNATNTTTGRQRVMLAQEIRNVQIEIPDWCPDTSVVRVTSTAQVAASKAIESIRAVQAEMVADELASAAESVLNDDKPFVVSAATRRRMASQLASGSTTVLKQEASGSQVIERIVAPVCDVTLSNEFVVNVSMGDGLSCFLSHDTSYRATPC